MVGLSSLQLPSFTLVLTSSHPIPFRPSVIRVERPNPPPQVLRSIPPDLMKTIDQRSEAPTTGAFSFMAKPIVLATVEEEEGSDYESVGTTFEDAEDEPDRPTTARGYQQPKPPKDLLVGWLQKLDVSRALRACIPLFPH